MERTTSKATKAGAAKDPAAGTARRSRRAASQAVLLALPATGAPLAETKESLREAAHEITPNDPRYLALMKLVPHAFFRASGSGEVLDFQAASEGSLAAFPVLEAGRRIAAFWPSPCGTDVEACIADSLTAALPQTLLFQSFLPGGRRDLELRVAPSGSNEVLGIVRDVTDHLRLEKEIIEISHREQQRIGQDLHDSLGQHLTGISFLSKALQHKLAAKSMLEAEFAEEISLLVVQAIAQTRNLARGLFPLELETSGLLVPALRELSSTTAAVYGIDCVLSCESGMLIQDVQLATHLFRIAQEAISNAMKHGKAKRIGIDLRRENEASVLEINDDGPGFDPRDVQSKGLGLRIMQYRAKRIGATVEFLRGDAGKMAVRCHFGGPGAGSDI